jgi:hypothetical protein
MPQIESRRLKCRAMRPGSGRCSANQLNWSESSCRIQSGQLLRWMYQDARKKPLSTRLCGWMSGVTNRKYMTTRRDAVLRHTPRSQMQ